MCIRDSLVHVVDISDPDFIYKTEQVLLILKELGISNIPCIRVNNKSDKVDIDEISNETSNNNNEVWVSALKNTGMEHLVNTHSSPDKHNQNKTKKNILFRKPRS